MASLTSRTNISSLHMACDSGIYCHSHMLTLQVYNGHNITDLPSEEFSAIRGIPWWPEVYRMTLHYPFFTTPIVETHRRWLGHSPGLLHCSIGNLCSWKNLTAFHHWIAGNIQPVHILYYDILIHRRVRVHVLLLHYARMLVHSM